MGPGFVTRRKATIGAAALAAAVVGGLPSGASAIDLPDFVLSFATKYVSCTADPGASGTLTRGWLNLSMEGAAGAYAVQVTAKDGATQSGYLSVTAGRTERRDGAMGRISTVSYRFHAMTCTAVVPPIFSEASCDRQKKTSLTCRGCIGELCYAGTLNYGRQAVAGQ